jgi:hypothetical protein
MGLNWSAAFKGGAAGIGTMINQQNMTTEMMYREISEANRQRFASSERVASQTFTAGEAGKTRALTESEGGLNRDVDRERNEQTAKLAEATQASTAAYQQASLEIQGQRASSDAANTQSLIQERGSDKPISPEEEEGLRLRRQKDISDRWESLLEQNMSLKHGNSPAKQKAWALHDEEVYAGDLKTGSQSDHLDIYMRAGGDLDDAKWRKQASEAARTFSRLSPEHKGIVRDMADEKINAGMDERNALGDAIMNFDPKNPPPPKVEMLPSEAPATAPATNPEASNAPDTKAIDALAGKLEKIYAERQRREAAGLRGGGIHGTKIAKELFAGQSLSTIRAAIERSTLSAAQKQAIELWVAYSEGGGAEELDFLDKSRMSRMAGSSGGGF